MTNKQDQWWLCECRDSAADYTSDTTSTAAVPSLSDSLSSYPVEMSPSMESTPNRSFLKSPAGLKGAPTGGSQQGNMGLTPRSLQVALEASRDFPKDQGASPFSREAPGPGLQREVCSNDCTALQLAAVRATTGSSDSSAFRSKARHSHLYYLGQGCMKLLAAWLLQRRRVVSSLSQFLARLLTWSQNLWRYPQSASSPTSTSTGRPRPPLTLWTTYSARWCTAASPRTRCRPPVAASLA